MITESPVSSLSLDPAGNLLLAGSINGDISLFDRRAGPEKRYSFKKCINSNIFLVLLPYLKVEEKGF